MIRTPTRVHERKTTTQRDATGLLPFAAMARSTPRLVVDARMVGPTPHGIARYVTLAARGIEAQRTEDPTSVPFEPWYLIDPHLNPAPDPRSFPPDRVRWVPAPFLSSRELWMVPRALRELGAAAFWSPSFASFPGLTCPWFVTIHDLNHLHYGSFAKKVYYRLLLKPFARRASRVLTVSEFSRGEISEWLSVSRESITVIPNAIDPAFWQLVDAPRPLGIPDGPYFLCLGSDKVHKNVISLVMAFRQWRQTRHSEGLPIWDLVITGMSPPEDYAQDSGIRWGVQIPDDELAAWFSSAGAVVFPSLYEGFGLPPAEAAALGVPVVASDISPHREVLADVAEVVTWVDPRNTGDICRGLDRTANDAHLRNACQSLSARIRERYSIAALSEGITELVASVLQENST